MNASMLDAARSNIGGLAELEAAFPRLQKAYFAALAVVVPPVDVDSALAEIIAGADIPDLGDEIARAQQRFTAREQQAEMLQRMLETVAERRRDIQQSGADEALAYLADQLEQILAETRPYLTDLQEVTSAEEAIDQDRVAQWTATGQLAQRYHELRNAQAVLVTAALFPPDQARIVNSSVIAARVLVQTFGTLKNYAELYPEPGAWWELADQGQQDRHRRDRLGNAVQPPPWLTPDPRANLAYIASEKADPWVPTIADMQAAAAAREEQLATGHQPGSSPLRFGERMVGQAAGRTRDLREMSREFADRDNPALSLPPIDVP